MLDELKSKEQLISELRELRKHIAKLESSKQNQKYTEFDFNGSDERFQSAFEYASIGMAIVSTNGNWLKVNPSLCKMLGYSVNELLTTNFQSITHPEDLKGNLDALGKMLSGEIHSYVSEKRYIHKEGHFIPCLISVSGVCDSQGKPLYFITQIQDISHRKLTEESLREAQKMTRALLDAHHDLALLADPQGIIYALNEKCTEKYGKKQEELIGSCIYNEFPPDMAKSRKAFLDEAVRTGKPIRHQDEKDGKYYDSTLYPILDNEGKVTKVAILTHDITAYKQSEERYRCLVELLPDALLVTINGKFAYVNNALLKMVKLNKPEEILGKNVLDYIHPDQHDSINNYVKEILEKGITSYPETRIIIPSDGTALDVESTATLFPYNGQKAILVVVRDISERKRAEEMRIRMEENDRALREAIEYEKLKTEFFSNISHELKTPLSVIFATLQLLKLNMQKTKMDRNDPKVNRYMHIMKQNGYRLLRLVNNIIDITKIDSNYLNLHLHNYDICRIVNDVAESVKEYIENRGIKLVLISEIKEKIIACDADKIERVMLNLLSNAIKFTGSGGSITVELSDLGEKVRIAVKDTGIGIPKEKLDIIFERFRQIDKSLTRNHEGSGIGLSIVKSLIEMHHGNIYAHSEMGKGSEFIFELPCITVHQDTHSGCKSAIPEHMKSERIYIEFSDIC